MKMKKISKMNNNCTSMWNSGHFDRKAQAALALAVSLWIANGGVVWAGESANWCEIDWEDGDTKYQMVSNPALSEGLQGTVTNQKQLSINIVDGFSGSSVSMPGNLAACFTTNTSYYNAHTGNSSVNDYVVNLTGKKGVSFNTLWQILGATINDSTSNYNVTNNCVNLQNVDFASSDSTEQIDVYGSSTSGTGAASNNTVAISGSNFPTRTMIYGGYSKNGDASGNTVTIADSEFKNDIAITVGGADKDGKTSENNTLNLYGSVKGLGDVILKGRIEGSNGTGNELHLGGTKDGHIINGVEFVNWSDGVTGTEGNKVKRAQSFDKIVLHQVKWDTTTPVLQTTATYATGGFYEDATLDISNMIFDTETPSGTLILLKSALEDEFVPRQYYRQSALQLTYKDKDGTLHENVSLGNGSITIKSITGGTMAPAVAPGVSLSYDSIHKVSLVNNNKEVQYSIDSDYKSAALGAMEWNKGYAFASGMSISNGLAVTFGDDFAVTGAASKTAGNSFDLLDLTVASGTLKSAVNKNVTVAMPDKAVTSALTFKAARTDTVSGEAGGKKVTYTVGSGSTVNSLVFNGAVAWNVEPHYDAAGTGYTFTNSTTIDASNFSFAGTATTDLKAGDNHALIANATGLQAGQTVTGGNNKTVGVAYKNEQGIDFDAAAIGNVTTAANTVNYTVNGVTLNSVDLAGWTGESSTIPTSCTKKEGGVSVTAAGFDEPETTKDIFVTDTENFFGTVTGDKAYNKRGSFADDTVRGVTLFGDKYGGVKKSDDGKKLTYFAEAMGVTGISLGQMKWGEGRTAAAGYDFANAVTVNAANLKFTNPEEVTGSGTLLTGAANLATGASIVHTQNFTKEVNGATLYATLSGNVTRETAGQIGYTVTGTTLDSISLTGWNGTEGSIPTGWTSVLGNSSITASSFAPNVAAGTTTNILTATNGFFSDSQITEAIKYNAQASSTDTANGVALTGSESKGVKAADNGTKLVYERSNFNINNIAFGTMAWGTPRGASAAGYDYSNAAVNMDGLTFSNPADIAANSSTTLLTANNTLALDAITETTKDISYGYSPVDGVTVNGIINGSYKVAGGEISYTATANNATKLTFGNVAWQDSGALMTRPANITFAGAAVDTSNINFTNISELEANKEMTLVGNFGDTVGTITGTKYMVGSTLQGEGKASLEGSNLIFRTDTTAEKMEVQEQTHNTVMSEEVALEALGAGDDFIAAAEDGLGHASNVGADGIASFATMGGGSIRQETGSHVDTRTWNAIIALGHKNEKEKCSFEYGAFFEYGRGNYTTYNGDQRGDGSTYYTGGGLLAKWQKKDGIYVEGSLRAGNVHDDAKNVLRDAMGNPYSYETDAPYWGVHVGVGKVIQLNESSELDVYGKFFHNHRNSVSFDAGGHYDLDAVNSDVLRLGTRYVMKREKWNFYGGLAYEQEFSGKAEGTADGMAIRGADTSGGSLRAELGAVLNPKKDGPITLDFNLSGFAGKKRGLTGGVAVTFNF